MKRVRGIVGAMDSRNPSDIPVVEKLAPLERERFAAEDLRPLAPPVVEREDGIDVTREEFSRDPSGYIARARPGFSVTVVDPRGSPRMRLEFSPPVDEPPDAA